MHVYLKALVKYTNVLNQSGTIYALYNVNIKTYKKKGVMGVRATHPSFLSLLLLHT